MKKITIIALHLGYGGIEKAIASLSNILCDDYEVNIISTYNLYDNPAFFIDKKVSVEYLMTDSPNKKELFKAIRKVNLAAICREVIKSLKILWLRKRTMIQAIKEIDSDAIISTRPFHHKLLGKYGRKNSVKIAWEHSHHNNNNIYINKLIRSCKNFDYLVSVSKELNDFYSEKFKNNKVKCKHISLSLDDMPETTSKLNSNQITSIGRLSKEKGFQDLIDIFAIVHKTYPKWKLNIVGDGLEKDKIEEKINTLKLTNHVIMHGFMNKKDIGKILENTSIYVMTSITESFGLVLIEAMSYGIPCLSFDSAKGPLEIVDNNINGFIISNRSKQEMANKIIELIKDHDLRNKMGTEARKKATIYSPSTVKREWVKIFKK